MEGKWKEIKLNELFKVSMGSKLDFSKMTFDEPKISFVGRSALFNGNKKTKVDKIDGVEPYSAGSITVALGGSIGSTFLQDEDFYTSQNVSVLIPYKKHKMNKYHKIFLITLLKHQFSLKFVAFGRELNRYIRDEISLLIPHTSELKIDWDYMENQIKKMIEIERNYISKFKYDNVVSVPQLDTSTWERYKVEDLFDVETVKYHQAKSLFKEGDIPLITQTSMNNGVETYVDKESFELEKGNCVIIGSIGITAFYQEFDFLSDLKIYKIYGNLKKGSHMNKEIGLFISTVINMEQFKYGYGRQYYSANLKNTYIKLPTIRDSFDKEPRPDWDYMIEYIKDLNNKVVDDFMLSPRNQ